jgi:hypothetical protein
MDRGLMDQGEELVQNANGINFSEDEDAMIW